jgi:antitoxin MazE
MSTQISRWGNSLAVRLPKAIVEAAGLTDGDEVTIREEAGRIVIERDEAIDLGAMIAAITDENRPDENFDWAPVGREIL